MNFKTYLLLIGIIFLNLGQNSVSAQDKLWEKLNDAGRKALRQSRFVEAEKYYTTALKQAKIFGEQQKHYAISLHNLGFAYYKQGKYNQAEPLFVRSLAIKQRLLGPKHSEVAVALNNLSSVYKAQNRYLKAEKLLLRSLTMQEQNLGPDHNDVGSVLNNLALVYDAQNKHEKA